MNTCHDIEPLLSELVDGALTPDEQRRVEAHLDTCAACRRIRRDLERVRRAARALAPVPPPDHVWLEVAGQVHPASGSRARRPTSAESRVAIRQWIGIAAMLMLVTAGAYFVMRAPEAPIPAGGNASGAGSVQAVTDEMGRAVQDYQNAIQKLETLVKEGSGSFDPALAATLQRNIQTMDGVIAESQTALGQTPQSAPARESLFEALKTKVGVLQATLNLMNEMRKGDQAAAAEAAAAFGRKSS
jgi:anti-sigma factor RsiW